MKHKGLFITLVLILLAGGAFLAGLAFVMFAGVGSTRDGFSLKGKVGVVTVDGPIVSADVAVKRLDRFRTDDSIRSVILRIESPGGSVAASQEILEAVRKLAGKKPVVASMGNVAASGGYYIACGATRVLANPGTITGSIGVRMEHVMLADLLQLIRVKHETLKSGKFKDIGSFDRPITPEEREILQGMLDDIHQQFKEEVAKSRGLTAEQVDSIADGRIYSGRQAKQLGLVDELGGLPDAIAVAGKLGGIKGDPKLVYPEKRNRLVERIFESAASVAIAKAKELGVAGDYWQPMMTAPLTK